MKNLLLLLLTIVTVKHCVFNLFEFVWLQFPLLGLCYLFFSFINKSFSAFYS